MNYLFEGYTVEEYINDNRAFDTINMAIVAQEQMAQVLLQEGLLQKAKDFFKNIWNNIKKAFSSLISWIRKYCKKVREWFVKHFGSGTKESFTFTSFITESEGMHTVTCLNSETVERCLNILHDRLTEFVSGNPKITTFTDLDNTFDENFIKETLRKETMDVEQAFRSINEIEYALSSFDSFLDEEVNEVFIQRYSGAFNEYDNEESRNKMRKIFDTIVLFINTIKGDIDQSMREVLKLRN